MYEEALNHKNIQYVYCNRIYKTSKKCNIYFPYIKDNPMSRIKLVKDEMEIDLLNNINYSRYIVENKLIENSGEKQYLKLLNKILNYGHFRQTRNANTLSLFGEN